MDQIILRLCCLLLVGCIIGLASSFGIPSRKPIAITTSSCRTPWHRPSSGALSMVSSSFSHEWMLTTPSSQAAQNATVFGYQDDVDTRYRLQRRSSSLLPMPFPSTTQQQQPPPPPLPPFRVYCDLDGVLTDFSKGVQQLFPEHPNLVLQHLHRPHMWERIANQPNFFGSLEWQDGGPLLWQAIRHLRPTILTGVPTFATSRQQKFAWCQAHLGRSGGNNDNSSNNKLHHVDMAGWWRTHTNVNRQERREDSLNVITCWSDCKHYESQPGAVLIDDCLALRAAWEAKGGIFVHHTSVEKTLEHLRLLGVLEDEGQ